MTRAYSVRVFLFPFSLWNNHKVIIKEFLPNPKGKDTEGEYLVIENNSDASISLSGWRVEDKSGKAFYLSGSLQPQDELQLPYSRTKISLNNKGETLFLFNAQGELIDEIGYSGTANEGRVIRRNLVLTEELKEEYFDELAFATPPGIEGAPTSFSAVTATMILAALIFASFSVYVVNRYAYKKEE